MAFLIWFLLVFHTNVIPDSDCVWLRTIAIVGYSTYRQSPCCLLLECRAYMYKSGFCECHKISLQKWREIKYFRKRCEISAYFSENRISYSVEVCYVHHRGHVCLRLACLENALEPSLNLLYCLSYCFASSYAS